jgi:hypothetical protein
MRTITASFALSAALLVSGCATIPDNASFLHGERFFRADIHTYPTVITHVDGQTVMLRTDPVMVTPGPHLIQLVAAPTAGFRFARVRELQIQVEPCRRYYIVARRENRLQQDWDPAIDQVETVGGSNCR